jgi:hypothetical protein
VAITTVDGTVDGISPAEAEEAGPGSAVFGIAGAIIPVAGGSEGGAAGAAPCDGRVVVVPSVATFGTCPRTAPTGELKASIGVEGRPEIADAAPPGVPLEAGTVVLANCWTSGITVPDGVVAAFATWPRTAPTGALEPPTGVEERSEIADAAPPTVPLEAVTVVEANCWTAGITVPDAVVPAAATCDRAAVTGSEGAVAEMPELADAAPPTVRLVAVTVLEADCSTGAARVSGALVVPAATCETAAVTGAATAARGVVAVAGTVEEAEGGGGVGLAAVLAGITEVGGRATTTGVGVPVGSEAEGFVAGAAGEVVVGVVGDEAAGALVADDTASPTLAVTPLTIPFPADWLAFEVALIELPSAVDAAEAEPVRRSAIKNPSPHAKSAKTA